MTDTSVRRYSKTLAGQARSCKSPFGTPKKMAIVDEEEFPFPLRSRRRVAPLKDRPVVSPGSPPKRRKRRHRQTEGGPKAISSAVAGGSHIWTPWLRRGIAIRNERQAGRSGRSRPVSGVWFPLLRLRRTMISNPFTHKHLGAASDVLIFCNVGTTVGNVHQASACLAAHAADAPPGVQTLFAHINRGTM
jgi:hypothetical protein